MRTSITWINDYLDPPADISEQAAALTRAGFPDEGEIDVENGEQSQDIEMTSNRGDCLCHVGLAREIAVVSGRTLNEPSFSVATSSVRVADVAAINNTEPEACPLYTARVIKGVRVQESPDWLKRRLEAIGLVPRNTLVDATNFVLFELGQPTHVFDLAKLAGTTLTIRYAAEGEQLLPIGDGAQPLKLSPMDLVIADAKGPIALAGVKGGEPTAVTGSTVDILLEAATFDPVGVRNTSRRHNVASDSSYRFERGVHAAEINHAAERLASLIIELSGGELCEGVLAEGTSIPKPRVVTLRPDRCRALLGTPITDEQISSRLAGLELNPTSHNGLITCTIPPRRLDLEREVDLIEEVGRTEGYDLLPINDRILIRAVEPQPQAESLHAMRTALVGLGFIECVTHSLIARETAGHFVDASCSVLEVNDDRAGAEPSLRPTLAASLLRVLRHNHDHGVTPLSVFETAATWHQPENDVHCERRMLALACDPPAETPTAQGAFAAARIACARLCRIVGARTTTFEPCTHAWLTPAATLRIDGEDVGIIGLIERTRARNLGHDKPVAFAQLELHPNGLNSRMSTWPPDSTAQPLPAFPAIDRDLSLIVEEALSWAEIERCARAVNAPMLDSIEFLTVFRSKKVGEGRKSISMRLRFRADDRTLRHDEVDPAVAAVRLALESTFNAEVPH